MTVPILWGMDSAPEASPRFPTRLTTALYVALPWLEIHDLPILESFPAGAFFEAARCVVQLPDSGFEETAPVPAS